MGFAKIPTHPFTNVVASAGRAGLPLKWLNWLFVAWSDPFNSLLMRASSVTGPTFVRPYGHPLFASKGPCVHPLSWARWLLGGSPHPVQSPGRRSSRRFSAGRCVDSSSSGGDDGGGCARWDVVVSTGGSWRAWANLGGEGPSGLVGRSSLRRARWSSGRVILWWAETWCGGRAPPRLGGRLSRRRACGSSQSGRGREVLARPPSSCARRTLCWCCVPPCGPLARRRRADSLPVTGPVLPFQGVPCGGRRASLWGACATMVYLVRGRGAAGRGWRGLAVMAWLVVAAIVRSMAS